MINFHGSATYCSKTWLKFAGRVMYIMNLLCILFINFFYSPGLGIF